MARPLIHVCRGSDCRKDHSKRLDRAPVELDGELVEVRCQKLCDGPVVGVEVDGRLEWFERVRGAKAVHTFVDLVRGGRLRDVLKKRRSKKRAGRLRL